METRERIDELQILQPCDVPWDAMEGGDQTRTCKACEKSVYNFAAMDESEIVDCIRHGDGNICARIRRSPDGKILTRQQAPKPRRLQFSLYSLLALMTSVAMLLGFSSHFQFGEKKVDQEDCEALGGAVALPDDFFDDEGV
jgi:hypothetical protein